MYDYMKSLHRQFFREPECSELRRSSSRPHRPCGNSWTKKAQTAAVSDGSASRRFGGNVSLQSFLAGYRLACGIYRELLQEPPHSFDREEEKRSEEIYQIEKKAAEAACSGKED
jgi:hypothetical protein